MDNFLAMLTVFDIVPGSHGQLQRPAGLCSWVLDSRLFADFARGSHCPWLATVLLVALIIVTTHPSRDLVKIP